MRHFLLFLISLIFLSCAAGGKQEEPYILWVNSSMSSCVGRAPVKCLVVQKTDTLDPEGWEIFQAEIKGFEFEAGYFYKLRVREDRPDAADPALEASSVIYTLVEILEKRQDMRFRIQGAWSLLRIKENELPVLTEGYATPRLEIRVGDMSYLGNDGCNNYMGGLMELDEQSIRFGVSAGTRMMCENMEVPDLFNASLSGIRTWEIKNERLHLFDAEGKEVMLLKLID
jgi:heat shock protein HslJ